MTKQNWQAIGKIGLLGLLFLALTRLISEHHPARGKTAASIHAKKRALPSP